MEALTLTLSHRERETVQYLTLNPVSECSSHGEREAFVPTHTQPVPRRPPRGEGKRGAAETGEWAGNRLHLSVVLMER